MDTLTILILSIHEQGISLFVSSSIFSSVFYSFQSIGISPPWLSFFLGILILLDVVINGIVFLIIPSDTLLLGYRNRTDFCLLILYPATLLNSFITSNSFLVESLGFFMCSIMSSANGDGLTSSLPQWMPHFFFLSDCCGLDFSITLDKSGKSGGAWVTWSVKHPTSAQVMISQPPCRALC